MVHAVQVADEAARLRVDLEARREAEQDARAMAVAAMAERDKARLEAAEFRKEAHRLRYKGEVKGPQPCLYAKTNSQNGRLE